MSTAPAGEVTGLTQSIHYAQHLADEAGLHGPDGNEGYLATLTASRVTGAGLATGRDMQAAFAVAAGAAAAHAAELGKQMTVQEQYDANPDAGDKTYLTGDAGTGTNAGQPGTAHTNDPKGTQVTENEAPAPKYHRCGECGYVVGPQAQRPRGCPNCRTGDVAFTATDIVFPPRPSDEAIARDTRDVEASIRQLYADLAERDGESVPLADIRDALPDDLDRETVDAALCKLAAHTGVHVSPHRDQKQTDPRTQQAALQLGGGYSHTLRIYRDRSLLDTLQVIRSTTRVQAESILAPLTDRDVAHLAEQMGVDTTGSPAELRTAVAERADTNHREWLADAEQGRLDGTLLYRADNEPDWVAGWTDDDRRQAAEAAARLQHRAATEESWAYVKDRADRWASTPATP